MSPSSSTASSDTNTSIELSPSPEDHFNGTSSPEQLLSESTLDCTSSSPEQLPTNDEPPMPADSDAMVDEVPEDLLSDSDTESELLSCTDSDDDDEPADSEYNPTLFQPLYPGAEITVCGAICAIMQFCTTHRLPYTAIDGLLKLLAILCPAQHHISKSFYLLKKFFEQFQSVHKHTKHCTKCDNTVSDCSCSIKSDRNTGQRVHLDIQKPLERILSSKYISMYLCMNYLTPCT